ncbi:MAG TPA: diacylglycerol kinase family protein [Solirubrobacteraceae bacterium]|nr:diacylglycerol kinase family protein [Solirubrobacteraceae bacterium]
MSTTSSDPLERLEAIVNLEEEPTPSRRMLIIVNPYASTVSDRLRNLVVYALRGRYRVHAVDTEARDHATEICREATREGYDVVVAFGGDGTCNEAANGLAGSDIPLCCLPGGRANVWCRITGIPVDIVDATEHLLAMAHDWRPRRVDLGRVNHRAFLFSAGVGLDASVVQRVDAHPRLKRRLGEWYYTWTGIQTFHRRYLIGPPRFAAEVDGERIEGVTAIVQNAAPYTYFGDRQVHMADDASLSSGELSGIILRRASLVDMPTIILRAFASGLRVTGHRRVTSVRGAGEIAIRSLDERPLPLQVDGDYIGEATEAHFQVEPDGLMIVS